MQVKDIIELDFINYSKPSMFIITAYCTFKCDKEAGCQVCQNSDLANSPIIEINNDEVIKKYLDNPITEAVVIGGLEPFDTFEELYQFIKDFRRKSNDEIVIYTGYEPNEINNKLQALSFFKNIIIKFGRFIPDSKHIYDAVLGVELASENQWAARLSDLKLEEN